MNVTGQFSAAMASAGIVTSDPIVADGNIHRVHVEGDRARTLFRDGRCFVVEIQPPRPEAKRP